MARGSAARLGSWACEEISKRFGVYITKTLDPLDPDDFILISVRLARSLRGATAGLEGEALKSAIESLDVDWPTLTEAKRDAIIRAARAEVAGLADTVAPIISPILEASASSIVPLTRAAAIERFSFTGAAETAGWVKNIVGDLRGSQMVYVKDQYGSRADRFDSIAKDVVAGGLERGLGRDDISEELAKQLLPLGIERGANYYNLVANDFANKSRTISQLNTFQDAGVTKWIFEATLDEATSEICRLLHGRTFSVKKAQNSMTAALGLRDPEEIRNAMPWVQASGSQLYFQRGDTKHDVATVHEPGEGTSDKIGTYGNVMSNRKLEAAGVVTPPRHGHCRSNILAVV